MQIRVMAGAFSFCIFSLGLFLGAGVRPLLMPAMKSEPALIGPNRFLSSAEYSGGKR
jgi:hypothetical protein